MTDILVDSNILLDVLTNDPHWFERSAATLARLGADHELVINPIVYAEVSVGFDRIEDLDAALPDEFFRREALPWEAAFLAGKCFVKYRRAQDRRQRPAAARPVLPSARLGPARRRRATPPGALSHHA